MQQVTLQNSAEPFELTRMIRTWRLRMFGIAGPMSENCKLYISSNGLVNALHLLSGLIEATTMA
jgi:hypothetical protein